MLIKLNSYTKAASRKEAFAIIEKMMIERDSIDGIGNQDIEQVYRYFLPAVPKSARTPANWIAKACSFKDARIFTAYLYATETRLCATDGHRLHFTDSFDRDEFPAGYFDPKGFAQVEQSYEYPNVERVIPKFNTRDFVAVDFKDCEQQTISTKDGVRIPAIKVLDNWLQLNYVVDATNGKDSFLVQKPGDYSFIFRNDQFNGYAVIMPMKD